VKSEISLDTRLQPPGQLQPGQLPPSTIVTPDMLWGGKFLHFIFAFVVLWKWMIHWKLI